MSAVVPALTENQADPPAATRIPPRYDNRITLHKLEVLCLVVELGGVSRAADHLWVAQSVVSGHLRSLQDRLGVQVFYREGQHLKLTKAGEQVHQWALETLARTRELMRTLDDASNGSLLVGASLTVGNYLLPPILAQVRRDWPHAAISMTVTDSDLTFDLVEKGECDLGIVLAQPDHVHPHVRSEVMGREDILLVAAPDSLAGVETLALGDLSGLSLVAPFAGTVAREAIDRQLVERGVLPQNAVMELGHPEAMKRVIRSGVDACLLFRSCVEDELRQGTLREIPLTDADLFLPVLSIEHVDRPRLPLQIQLIDQVSSYLAAR